LSFVSSGQATKKREAFASRFDAQIGLQTEVRAVLGDKRNLISGHVFLGEDRADGAGGNARAAVNALLGVNVELIVTLVDAFDGANFDAGGILRADAGLTNDVGHDVSPFGTRA
jgi:hypothetical protein